MNHCKRFQNRPRTGASYKHTHHNWHLYYKLRVHNPGLKDMKSHYNSYADHFDLTDNRHNRHLYCN